MAAARCAPDLQAIYTKTRTIGLLGGSFNPAHEGHVHISLEALKRLKLDQVWWLVSPQNPLKSTDGMAPYAQRFASALRLTAHHAQLQVSGFELRHHTRYTVETVARLKQRYPGTRFIWIMGADNLASLHRWHKWRQLLDKVPIAVFDRVPYSYTALRSKACAYTKGRIYKKSGVQALPNAPAIIFFHFRRHPLSSTQLRKTLGEKAFLGHNGEQS